MKSGMHHPYGLFWIRRPDHKCRVFKDTLPLRAVAPTILDTLGVQPPDYMGAKPVNTDGEVFDSVSAA